jgi:molecular chaperone GrpE (heat shock protein)
MTITQQQIEDLRADIGDPGGDDPTFTDVEIGRIWDRLSGASDATQRHDAALALMARQLLTQAARLHKYTAGNTSEDLQQVFDHLEKLYKLFSPALAKVQGTAKQMGILGLRDARRDGRTVPDSEGWSAEPD